MVNRFTISLSWFRTGLFFSKLISKARNQITQSETKSQNHSFINHRKSSSSVKPTPTGESSSVKPTPTGESISSSVAQPLTIDDNPISLNRKISLIEEEGDLDVLIWWKDNCTRYPVLARIAREVLAIPVSTVASESAFSTGGRVLDAYRSSLSAITVEPLICTQDWVKKKDHGIETSSLVSYDDLNTLQQLEQDFLSNLGSSSASTRLDDD
ncbi:zinc finger BED domain-containing protein RICESLEEPER 3-like isoform X1 [Trifolium pratense]|uniref:zinc finger BED domain-containing protein RICESLEEPER 3-like isoform X1 n=1 Tax=Trifolium pratense TaxID=57577 RepID=UPI001E69293E|nr:zinc finger BED domain-containing protein RICESLEEPER 3-like isoform X1 [Trifolium pratense]